MNSKYCWTASLDALISWVRNEPSVCEGGGLKIAMNYSESAFLGGLLQKVRPKKIVEIGVYAGGTSSLLLKSIDMLGLDSKLYSVDILDKVNICDKYGASISRDIGFMVHLAVPELASRWRLYTGKIASEFLPEIGSGIDFCIIDTMHVLPGELLDFLCVLPFLGPEAIVVLHDTALHFIIQQEYAYATRVLFSSVVADKIIIEDPQQNEGIANIAAFKVTSDTHKYIANVFSALYLPWKYIPDHVSLNYLNAFFSYHYDPPLLDVFRQAVNLNASLRNNPIRLNRDAPAT